MHDLFIPAMGMAPDDVTLISWLVRAGDAVTAGQPVAVVETSKAELEIESEADGVLGPHLVSAMERVAPGTTIGHVLAAGESDPTPAPDQAGAAPTTAQTAAPTTAQTAATVRSAMVVDDAVGADVVNAGGSSPDHAVDDGISATVAAGTGGVVGGGVSTAPAVHVGSGRAPHELSPRARRLAAAAASIPADPLGAAVAREQAAAQSGAPAQDLTTPDGDTRYRDAISAAVTRSWHEIPHFTVTRELHVGALVDTARDLKAVVSGVTLTDLLLRALALSLVEREQRTDLDLGLAVATERGVAIPVIRDVLRLDLLDLVAARRSAVERAKAGRLHPDDGRVPVTTLSNLGAVGVDQFTGVVPYGQTSLLTVGRAAARAVVDADGELAVATTMAATLNADHRSWDGLHAGLVLDRLARIAVVPTLVSGITTARSNSV